MSTCSSKIKSLYIFFYTKRLPSQTVLPISFMYLLLKRDRHLLYCERLDFKVYSSLLQYSGCIQSKNGVNLVEVSIFLYIGEDEQSNYGQTIQSKKIKQVALFYLWPPSLQSFFLAFTMLWTRPVQKLSGSIRSVLLLFLIGQDGGEIISTDQDRKATTFMF